MYVDNFTNVIVIYETTFKNLDNCSKDRYTYSERVCEINFKQDIKDVIDTSDNWMLGFGKKRNRDVKSLSKSYKKRNFKIPEIFKQFG